jgi:lysophospholipid acyltransferase (LPLAT)-like uncharacterized protein
VSLIKKVTRSESVRGFLCWLGAQFIRLVRSTGSWQVEGGEFPAAFWSENKPFILAFWHGRIMMMPYCWPRNTTIRMLISQHRDGQFIARTVAHFGIDTVAGSSSKGGSAALRSMLRSLKQGECVGITPDGPRGPRMRASDGIVHVARMSGVPVIPCGFSAKRRKVLGSWDRFTVAFPFTRGVFVWGEPVTVPADATAEQLEQARLAIENGLTHVTQSADRLMGHTPVEPAAL